MHRIFSKYIFRSPVEKGADGKILLPNSNNTLVSPSPNSQPLSNSGSGFEVSLKILAVSIIVCVVLCTLFAYLFHRYRRARLNASDVVEGHPISIAIDVTEFTEAISINECAEIEDGCPESVIYTAVISSNYDSQPKN